MATLRPVSVTLRHLKVPVTFDESAQSIEMAGVDLTPADWVVMRDKVDAFLRRAGTIPQATPPESRSFGSHPFLLENIKAVNKFRRGHIKNAPWWLRWIYDGIVTKENYRGYD
jgi:hypothetical protein